MKCRKLISITLGLVGAPFWARPGRGIAARRPLPQGLAGLLVVLLFTATAHARINVVTLPERDSVQLTIYNSADLTMVKETRVLTFKKGINRLEFSWANTLIDPTSVEFRALTKPDQVDVLDVSFPPRVTNTLEWRIRSEVAGEVTCEIRYFTSGISWASEYVAETDKSEKTMTLAGAVRVNNNSGEDYENAQVRLVVGVIRLVEQIVQLAQQGKPGAQIPPPMPATAPAPSMVRYKAGLALAEGATRYDARPREMVKEEMSEYFLYTVEGRDTIPNGWAKRMPSFKAADVPITSYYKFERERWGEQVIRHYKFKNDKESKLGTEPLPNGAVLATRRVSADNLLAFTGRTQVKYIPINEAVELELGNDREVMIKPKLMDWVKEDVRYNNEGNVAGWTTREQWVIEVQNSKDIDIVLDIRRSFAGDWTLKTEDKYETVDKSKVKFVLPLKAREKQKLAYELTTR
jgi:hypothetical protein